MDLLLAPDVIVQHDVKLIFQTSWVATRSFEGWKSLEAWQTMTRGWQEWEREREYLIFSDTPFLSRKSTKNISRKDRHMMKTEPRCSSTVEVEAVSTSLVFFWVANRRCQGSACQMFDFFLLLILGGALNVFRCRVKTGSYWSWGRSLLQFICV